jgi:hypothetical protein
LGGAYHYSKSRSARLSEGWYGYWRDIHGVLYTAGFGGQGPGELPYCFVAAKSWDGIKEPTPNNLFQQALRLAWELPSQSLDQLEVCHTLSLFLNPNDKITPLIRMRDWFQSKFTILNDTLAQHTYMLHGFPEASPQINDENPESGYSDSNQTNLEA